VRHFEMLFVFLDFKDLRFCMETVNPWEPPHPSSSGNTATPGLLWLFLLNFNKHLLSPLLCLHTLPRCIHEGYKNVDFMFINTTTVGPDM
jgi:hypothetical protein